ncbi:hypothetical protein [Streptomyces sp. AP-93]|uniref:hypothetical protein n=1 Tax=Streptomyces sp. AP-93 TaxID=2929048 RepID=UPI001FAED4F4|nr:hypothetical protein [Streptomyces sp. AP-93]MCJ0870801.1 hypothetical protein [Streptomyces sp. AP-93]
MKLNRVMGALAVTVAATVLPMVAATPASADQGDCQYYLHTVRYVIGPKVESACKAGSANPFFNPGRWGQCYYGLTGIGVRQEHAVTACNRAGW